MIIKNKNLMKYTYLDVRRIIKFYPKPIGYIIYGAGGIGKTETLRRFLNSLYKDQIKEIQKKTWSMEDLLQKKIKIKNKFVWLNRTQLEIDNKKKNLFNDFGWTSVGAGNEVQIPIRIQAFDKKDKIIEVYYYLTLGNYEAINNSSKIRGGNSFKGYQYIIWDEFMDENDHYLDNELKRVKSILMTVLRSKKGTKWFFLSNTVSQDNTLFKEFNFNPKTLKKGEQGYDEKRKLLFYYVSATQELHKEYKDSDFMTVFGEDDPYAKYRFGAEFVDDDDKYIERELKGQLKPKFNVLYLGNTYGVYDYRKGLYFSSHEHKAGKVYPLTKPDAVNISKQFRNVDGYSNWFYTLLKNGKIYFEDGIVKEAILRFVSKGR